MATGIASWTPRTAASYLPPAVTGWIPQASGRVVTGRISWRPVTVEVEGPKPPCLIVLARPADFEFDDLDRPRKWLPLSRGQFGTAAATRELGWGTVLSEDRGLRAPADVLTDAYGLNLAGTVGDETDTLTVHCDIHMLDPETEPRTGDIFTRRGVDYCIYEVQFHSEKDADREMTVSGIRWNGCGIVSTPVGLTPPFSWS